MPELHYKGHVVEYSRQLTQKDIDQTKAYLDHLGPKISRGAAADRSALDWALGANQFITGLVGDVGPGADDPRVQKQKADALITASQQAEQAAAQHPVSSGAARVAMAVGTMLHGGPLSAAIDLSLAPILGTSLAGTAAGAVGGIIPSGAEGGSKYTEILRHTGDPDLALQTGINTGAMSLLGFAAAPGIKFGSSLPSKIATGAGTGATINATLGEGEVAIQNEILSDYPRLQQELGNPTRMAINAALGGVAGMAGGYSPKSFTPSGVRAERAEAAFLREISQTDKSNTARQQELYSNLETHRENLGRDSRNFEHQIRAIDEQLLQADLPAAQRIELEQARTGIIKNVERTNDSVLFADMHLGREVDAGAYTIAVGNRQRDIAALESQLSTNKFDYDQGRISSEDFTAKHDSLTAQTSDLKEQLVILDGFTQIKTQPKTSPIASIVTDPTLTTEQKLKALSNESEYWLQVPNSKIKVGPDVTPHQVGSLQALLKNAGLENYEVELVSVKNLGGKHAHGAVTFSGDKIHIALGAADIMKALDSLRKANSVEWQKYFDKASIADIARVAEDFALAHEIGHVLLVKSIQDSYWKPGKLGAIMADYTKWRKENELLSKQQTQLSPTQQLGEAHLTSGYLDFTDFNEFFAQRVARYLVYPSKFASNNPIKNFTDKLKDMVNTIFKGNRIPLKKNELIDSIVQDLLKRNQKEIAQHGEDLTNIAYVKASNQMTNHKTLEDSLVELGSETLFFMHPAVIGKISSAKTAVEDQIAAGDIGPSSINSIFGKLTTKILPNMFGALGAREILGGPMIDTAVRSFHKHHNAKVSFIHELMNGRATDTEWSSSRFKYFKNFVSLNSPQALLNRASDADLVHVMGVFHAGYGKSYGIDYKLNDYDALINIYKTNLAKNGVHLTPIQRALYDSLATMFKDLLRKTNEGLLNSGKKEQVNLVAGWFPSNRVGGFEVSIHVPGANRLAATTSTGSVWSDVSYSERFFSREEAEAFVEVFNSAPNKYGMKVKEILDLDEIKNKEVNQANYDAMQQAEFALLQENNTLGARTIQELRELILARGGKVSGHNIYRRNVPGSRGTEMFRSKADKAKRFKDSIYSAVNDYATILEKQAVSTELDLILTHQDTTKVPNATAIVTEIRDYVLGNYTTLLEKETRGLNRGIDTVTMRAVNLARKAVGAEPKHAQAHTYVKGMAKAQDLLMIKALISNAAFIAAQGMQPLLQMRHLAREAGLFGALYHVANGTRMLALGNSGFDNYMRWAVQDTSSISPQLRNDFSSTNPYKTGVGKTIFDLITLESPAAKADSFSRTVFSSWLYSLYEKRGYTPVEFRDEISIMSDTNMVQYGQQFKAPMFAKGGAIGQELSPLTTFPLQALALTVADVKNFVLHPRAKTMAPLVATGLVTIGLVGTSGLPFGEDVLTALEFARQQLIWLDEELGWGYNFRKEIPSMKDIYLQGEPTLLTHGAIGISTGMDIGSSLRWQAVIPAIFRGEKDFQEALPRINFTIKTALAIKNAALELAYPGILTPAERLRTERDLTMLGWTKGIIPAMKGDENIMAASGNGVQFIMPWDNKELLAATLGTKTLNRKQLEAAHLQRIPELKKKFAETQSALLARYTEAYLAGDIKQATKIGAQLTALGTPVQTVADNIRNTYYKQNVDIENRNKFGPSGKITPTQDRSYNWTQEFSGEVQQ